jgi:hypothetical protein
MRRSETPGGSPAAAAPADPVPRTRTTAAPVDGKRWFVLAVVAVSQLMIVLDGSIVNIALPQAQRAFDSSDANR